MTSKQDSTNIFTQPGGVIQVVTRTEDGAHLTALTITGTVCLGKTQKATVRL